MEQAFNYFLPSDDTKSIPSDDSCLNVGKENILILMVNLNRIFFYAEFFIVVECNRRNEYQRTQQQHDSSCFNCLLHSTCDSLCFRFGRRLA